MSDSDKQMLEILEEWSTLFIDNVEYQRLICRECRVGVTVGFVGKHLKKRHGIKMDMANRVEKHIRARHWSWVDCLGLKPEDGKGAQEGLDVFDGIRCKFCRNFNSRSVVEVEEHWKLMRHGEMKGCSIEAVPMQSWVGREGKRPELWVVEKREEREKSFKGCKVQKGHAEEIGDWQLEIIKEGLKSVGLGDEWVVA